MILTSDSFADGARIPGEFAFCIPADEGHVCLGSNANPHLAWKEVPPGTRSFVLICRDLDVPSVGDDVNQEGRTVHASLPRVEFFHWVLVDIAADTHEIAAGSFCSDVTPGGKPGPDAYGYDGPCPPWNDELRHHYVFTLYALDVARCPVDGRFGGADVRAAIEPHILAETSVIGTYTLNPAV